MAWPRRLRRHGFGKAMVWPWLRLGAAAFHSLFAAVARLWLWTNCVWLTTQLNPDRGWIRHGMALFQTRAVPDFS